MATHNGNRYNLAALMMVPGTKVVRHARYVTFQLAEVAVLRRLQGAFLERLRRFAAPQPRAAPA